MSVQRKKLNDLQSSRRRHLFGFGAVVLLAMMLIGMTVNAVYAARERRVAEDWQLHTLNVLLTTEQLRSSASESLRTQRTYLLANERGALPAYRRSVARSADLAIRLRDLTGDNQDQARVVLGLHRQIGALHAVLDESVRGPRQENAASIAIRGVGRPELEAAMATLDRIEDRELQLLATREAASAQAERANEIASYLLAFLAFASLLVVTWAGIMASKARMHTLKLEARLRRMATTDELTGLLNRRAFLTALDTEIARANRSGSPLAVAVIDLDHFKQVNDRFGHQGGDDVLRKFAEIAHETTRTADVVGRLGGEEFAVLMPDTDRVQSGIAAERLRDAVARRHFVTSTGALVPTTVSVGVAHFMTGENRDHIINRADEALYDAKHDGRNRTRLAA